MVETIGKIGWINYIVAVVLVSLVIGIPLLILICGYLLFFFAALFLFSKNLIVMIVLVAILIAGALEAMLDRVKPRLLFFEALTNPLLIVVDGGAAIKAAKDRGIRVIVDNTFCTPLLWKPLKLGADLVVHSATKYFSGHGNITAGVIAGDDAKLGLDARTYRKLIGQILGPDDAYRLGTQLQTLPLRNARQCESALRLARLLEDHPKVASVRYPGLDTHLTHAAEAKRLFEGRGFGAMLTSSWRAGARRAMHSWQRPEAGSITSRRWATRRAC